MPPHPLHSAERPRILIVDDDRRARDLLTAYLGAKHEVIAAADAALALQLVEKAVPDLVITDVMMPGMNGFELCRLLKQGAKDTFLPVLMLTALGDQEHRNQGLAVGADDFLSKPVDRRELELRVATFVRLATQERTIRRQVVELRALQSLKDDMVALIAHDVKNPLQGLIWGLNLMERLAGKTDQPLLTQTAVRSLACAHRLDNLLSDLLQVKLFEDVELRPRVERVSVGELLQGAVEGMWTVAEAQQVAIKVDCPAGLEAKLDRALVQRAVENLVGNAIKYSPQNEAVTVRASARDGALQLEVHDRGPGIPANLRQLIFEKFGAVEAGLDSSVVEQRRGHGLGLYLVKLAVSSHGGQVTVRDAEGGGSVFSLSLPLGQAASA